MIKDLSPLPVQDDKYLLPKAPWIHTINPEFKTDRPSVFGALGMLPKRRCWIPPLCSILLTGYGKTGAGRIPGDGFPWLPWPPRGCMNPKGRSMHCWCPSPLIRIYPTGIITRTGLTIYLPGNGGLLTAVAMMCAGMTMKKNLLPGIPKNGKMESQVGRAV